MKIQELFEDKDPAAATLSAVSKALRSMGFKKASAGDTQGTKRVWMIQAIPKTKPRVNNPDLPGYETISEYDKKILDSMKYSFMSKESNEKFVKDFEAAGGGKLEIESNSKEYSIRNGCEFNGEGFSIKSQNDDNFGQVVVTVAKGNKAGERYKQGYDT